MRVLILIALIFSGPSFASTCKDRLQVISSKVTTQAPVLILSGPSGAGKTTVLQKVIAKNQIPLRAAIGVTTRAPRPGEVDGKNYHFWTKEKFQESVKNGEFIEHAEVHGNFYGTLKSEVDAHVAQGTAVVLVIDVQGEKQARKLYPEAVSVFLKPSSIDVIEKRLRSRGTETEENIQKRLKNATGELAREQEYDHTVINDSLDDASNDLSGLIRGYFPKK